MEGSEPSEKGKLLLELQNTGCAFCNVRGLSNNFISLKRVFSKIVTVPGVQWKEETEECFLSKNFMC